MGGAKSLEFDPFQKHFLLKLGGPGTLSKAFLAEIGSGRIFGDGQPKQVPITSTMVLRAKMKKKGTNHKYTGFV